MNFLLHEHFVKTKTPGAAEVDRLARVAEDRGHVRAGVRAIAARSLVRLARRLDAGVDIRHDRAAPVEGDTGCRPRHDREAALAGARSSS